MGILIRLLRHIGTWDRPSQIALSLALVLFLIAFIILLNVPSLQTPAIIAIIGLLLAIQGIVMWGNRNLVTAYTRAQRLFLEGDLGTARDLLEAEISANQTAGKPTKADIQVLLGNIYRNLGEIGKSDQLLQEACRRAPHSPFALYGLGRTYLVKGEFASAADLIQRAYQAGAPESVLLDLALAYAASGRITEAQDTLRKSPGPADPYRNLMAAYLSGGTLRHPVSDDALAFWQAEAERFPATPYGEFVAQFLDDVQVSG